MYNLENLKALTIYSLQRGCMRFCKNHREWRATVDGLKDAEPAVKGRYGSAESIPLVLFAFTY